MQGSGEISSLIRTAEMLLVCERDIIDSAYTNYRRDFDSAKSKAQHTIQLLEKLGKLKWEFKKSEDALVKALSVKTRKEARRMATMEFISSVRARVQELKGVVRDLRGKKDRCAALISKEYEDLTAYKEEYDQKKEDIKEIEAAISWYNRVLGVRVEPGRGVKFIFTNISRENPNEEYSFVIRLENGTYTLLSCNPHLTDTKVLVVELNKSDGFEFVRTMREKFQQAAAQGISARSSFSDEASSIISLSAPITPVSTDPGYTSLPENLESAKSNSNSRKVGKEHTVQSPRSASSVRSSSPLKGKKRRLL